MMEGKSSGVFIGIYRTVTSIAAVITPFIFIGVLRVYNTLDSYGNRITAVETEMKATSRDIDRIDKEMDAHAGQIKNLSEYYYTEIYPRFYGK